MEAQIGATKPHRISRQYGNEGFKGLQYNERREPFRWSIEKLPAWAIACLGNVRGRSIWEPLRLLAECRIATKILPCNIRFEVMVALGPIVSHNSPFISLL